MPDEAVIHGHTLDLDDDATFELVRATAEGQRLDVEAIAARLAARKDRPRPLCAPVHEGDPRTITEKPTVREASVSSGPQRLDAEPT